MFEILQLKKISPVILFTAILLSFFGAHISTADAFWSGNAVGTGNTLTAARLSASVSGPNITGLVLPGFATTTDFILSKPDLSDMDFQYTATVKIIGDQTACGYITMSASSSPQHFSGSLSDFLSATSSVSDSVGWSFVFNVSPSVPASDLGKICNFKISYQVWQKNLPNSSYGFSDLVEVPESIQVGVAIVPPTVPGPGSVVINELMWMGSSGHSSDEWIELRNMTTSPIDLSGWTLEKAAISGGTLTIPSGKIIPAGGYFLIANYSNGNINSSLAISPDWVTTSVSLNNSNNGNVILKNSTAEGAVIIDTALGSPAWPAGTNATLKQSMERNVIPGDGTLTTSWHTCVDTGCNSSSYWQTAGSNNYGTPGAGNLSSNDPTSSDYDPSLVALETVISPLDTSTTLATSAVALPELQDSSSVASINTFSINPTATDTTTGDTAETLDHSVDQPQSVASTLSVPETATAADPATSALTQTSEPIQTSPTIPDVLPSNQTQNNDTAAEDVPTSSPADVGSQSVALVSSADVAGSSDSPSQ
jgi:hypothetical protein